jgi:two-component system, chemotaxis family, protein-glutamate methylesterase/glutaminase
METRDIIVIGASAGGLEAIKQLVANLPANLEAAVFIVWHMAPDIKGILPHVLNKQKKLYAINATDREQIVTSRIYVAPPNRHLLIEKGQVRVTHGPKENGFRPAIDPLFRSAAYHHGPRVIGIILSGSLDDGTSGLWTIKKYGGLAIVQDPLEAEVPSMPEHAIQAVAVDHIVPVSEMAPLLEKLTTEAALPLNNPDMENKKKIEKEIRIAIQDKAMEENIMLFGELTPYTCPECHGVLSAIKEGGRTRYRCHTGHAFSADGLMTFISKDIEQSLWNTIRSMEEGIILLNHMGDHFAEDNQPHLAAKYFKKANEIIDRSKLVRQAILNHEYVSPDNLKDEVQHSDPDQAG